MYERNLKDELFACHQFLKIPFDDLCNMPIADRKYYIHKWNEYMEMRNAAMQGDGVSTASDADIRNATSMSQGIGGDDLLDI